MVLCSPLCAAVEKFQAAFILLRSFGSAATYLNPESTRFTGVYTVEYDALGSLQGATFKVGRGREDRCKVERGRIDVRRDREGKRERGKEDRCEEGGREKTDVRRGREGRRRRGKEDRC